MLHKNNYLRLAPDLGTLWLAGPGDDFCKGHLLLGRRQHQLGLDRRRLHELGHGAQVFHGGDFDFGVGSQGSVAHEPHHHRHLFAQGERLPDNVQRPATQRPKFSSIAMPDLDIVQQSRIQILG